MLGTAFVSVMAGAGGLFGAVAGVVLALLGRSVLHMGAGTLEFMIASVLIGAAAALILGVFLTARESLPVFLQTWVGVPASAGPVATKAQESP
jgi:hypothetical protein